MERRVCLPLGTWNWNTRLSEDSFQKSRATIISSRDFARNHIPKISLISINGTFLQSGQLDAIEVVRSHLEEAMRNLDELHETAVVEQLAAVFVLSPTASSAPSARLLVQLLHFDRTFGHKLGRHGEEAVARPTVVFRLPLLG